MWVGAICTGSVTSGTCPHDHRPAVAQLPDAKEIFKAQGQTVATIIPIGVLLVLIQLFTVQVAVYVPAVETVIEGVVAPFDHKILPPQLLLLRMALSPVHNILSASFKVTVGTGGAGFTTTV